MKLSLIAAIAITALCARAASVSISWDPPVPSNSVSGYQVYYGTASRDYPDRFDAGGATTFVVPDLDTTKTYYFALTAYSSSGNESDFSAELVWDNSKPTITGPKNVTLKIDEGLQVALPDYRDQFVTADNFSLEEDIILTQTPVPGTMVDKSLTVMITAADEAGNTNFFVCAVGLDVVPKPGLPVGVTGSSDGKQLLINDRPADPVGTMATQGLHVVWYPADDGNLVAVVEQVNK